MTKKENYIDSVKEELEKLLESENVETYEFSINKEELKSCAKIVCKHITPFDGDKWQLAELVAAEIFEKTTQLPGSSVVAFLALKLFRKGIDAVCKEFSA